MAQDARAQALAACAQADGHIAARRWAQAADCFSRAVAIDPGFAQAWCNLGAVLNELGRSQEAEAPLRRALELQPGYVQALGNLANALKAQGRPAQAEPLYREALALAPGIAALHYNLGSVLAAQDRFAEAEAALRQAVALVPGLAVAHNNLGLVLTSQGRLNEAAATFRHALDLAPTLASAANNLGNALRQNDDLHGALAAYRRALDIDPDHVEAHYNMGGALADLGHPGQAIAALRRALHLRPDYPEALGQLLWVRRRQCDWDGDGAPITELEERVLAAVRAGKGAAFSPFLLLNIPATPDDQALQAAAYAAKTLRGVARLPPLPAAPRPAAPPGRLRVGYLSNDLYSHATAHLLAGVIEAHDRSSVEVLAYAWGRDDASAIARRIRGAFDRVVEIGALSHEQAARRIQADGVDILVDLKGYTEGGRPAILAARPAPIQVSYLGYPGPLGLDAVDYVLADAVVLPRDRQADFVERIVHLPDCYQPNDDKRAVAPVPGRAWAGLPLDAFVFCCLNTPHKIRPDLFALWMRVLKAVPGSVLWLLDAPLPHPAAGAGAASGAGSGAGSGPRAHLLAAAAAQGIAPDRLVFAPALPPETHVGRHVLADLFLDTLPYTAHTAASDALWAGLPLLTCPGESFAARVAASLLTAMGLPDLIAPDLAAYEALAVRLARDPALLADVRARLTAARTASPLFDTKGQARALEHAYRHMAARHAAGLAPAGFALDRQGGVTVFPD